MLYYNTKAKDVVSYTDIAQLHNISLPVGAAGPDDALLAKLGFVATRPDPNKPTAGEFEEVVHTAEYTYKDGDEFAYHGWEIVPTLEDILDDDGNVVSTREQQQAELDAEAATAAEVEAAAAEAAAAKAVLDEAEAKLIDLRLERDELLILTDKYTISDWPHADDATRTAWLTYRQELRDLPTHANWPDLEDGDWPTAPDASEDESE